MAKRKTDKPKYTESQVEQLMAEARSEVKASRTLYDDRNELLEAIEDATDCLEHHEQCVHNAKLNLQDLRQQLARTNLAIRRELDLNR